MIGLFIFLALANKNTAREKEAESINNKAALPRHIGGNSAIAMNSPVSGMFKGDPFFDPWAKGGKFNK